MDSMRSVLMMLGVVLHSSNVFDPKKDWLIFGDQVHNVAGYLGEIIHIFRMPAFFIISGFFCVFTLNKYGVKKFLSLRLIRIAVPLLFTSVILNSVQQFLLNYSGFSNVSFFDYFSNGFWVGHLWFLINIFIYFLVSALLYYPCRSFFSVVSSFLNKFPIFLIFLFLPFVHLAILSLNSLGFPLYTVVGGAISVYSLLNYFIYFVFGIIIFCKRELLLKFSTVNPFVILFFMALSILVLDFESQANQSLTGVVVLEYFNRLLVWCASSLCFYIFYRYFNFENGVWNFLSDASYTVYLFHHFIVISLGLFYVNIGMPPLIGLFTMMLITFILTIFIHKHLILKFKLLRFMFNGKV